MTCRQFFLDKWCNPRPIQHLFVVRSFNQPNLCVNASWNPNAETYADSSTVGQSPYSIFINTNNTIVVANHANGRILIWSNKSNNLATTSIATLSSPMSVFVTSANEIFVDNGSPINEVGRWTFNGTQLSSPMSMLSGSACFGLFVDVNNTLYCSQNSIHRVVKTSLNDPSGTLMIAAGSGSSGSASYMLSYPNGVFVTSNLDLYVADSGNNRIQLFRAGERNGTTVAGNGTNDTIALSHPIGIVVDADRSIFIVDHYGHHISRSGPSGSRCLVGCTGSSGSAPNQLLSPRTLSFDTDGNMFVVDQGNSRIQMFALMGNSCGE